MRLIFQMLLRRQVGRLTPRGARKSLTELVGAEGFEPSTPAV